MGRSSLWVDVLAGVSVALVLIPQSLAYADLAGMPPWHGLYVAAVAPILAAFFASSRYLQTGPGAMTSLLTAGALGGMAVAGSNEYVALAALLALVVGVVRVSIGILRGGALAYMMARPVVLGFTMAAALLILSSQLPAALGIPAHGVSVLDRARWVLVHPGQWSMGAVGLSVLTLALMYGGKRLHPLFPGVLAAVLVGLGASLLGWPIGPTIGEVPAGLPRPSLNLPWASLPSLIVPGIVIAIVGFAEAAAISRTFAIADRERWEPNKEFISQGAANVAAGLFGGFPVGGSFSRSSLGRLAGAKTRRAGAVTGLAVLLFLPWAGVLAPLPRAILGATVIGAVLPLFRPKRMINIWRQSRPQWMVAWGTFAGTLVAAPHVEYGVLGGVMLAAGVHLWREMRLTVRASIDNKTLTLSPMGVLWFGSAPHLELRFNTELARYPEAQNLLLDLGGLGRVDLSGAASLSSLIEDAQAAGLKVNFAGVPPHAERILARLCPDILRIED